MTRFQKCYVDITSAVCQYFKTWVLTAFDRFLPTLVRQDFKCYDDITSAFGVFKSNCI